MYHKISSYLASLENFLPVTPSRFQVLTAALPLVSIGALRVITTVSIHELRLGVNVVIIVVFIIAVFVIVVVAIFVGFSRTIQEVTTSLEAVLLLGTKTKFTRLRAATFALEWQAPVSIFREIAIVFPTTILVVVTIVKIAT